MTKRALYTDNERVEHRGGLLPAYIVLHPAGRGFLPVDASRALVKRSGAIATEMQYFPHDSEIGAIEEAERLAILFPGEVFMVAEIFAVVSFSPVPEEEYD